MQLQLDQELLDFLIEINKLNINPYLVGGCVRDMCLPQFNQVGNPDIDICLVGLTNERKPELIRLFDNLNIKYVEAVNHFSVFIVNIGGKKVDFAPARTEVSTGPGYTDFNVSFVDVSINIDLKRRDLTINSMAINPLTGELIDPYGGLADLKNGILRHTNSLAFGEDPLRPFRLCKFAGRYGFEVHPETIELCRSMIDKMSAISIERIGKEFMNAMQYSEKPSMFFETLREIGWLEHLFPELYSLIGVKQDPKHHPEGDVWNHTMLCLDNIENNIENNLVLRLTMLLHDVGKASTTLISEDGKITAYNHEKVGAEMVAPFMQRFSVFNKDTIKKVETLVKFHMIHSLDSLSHKHLFTVKKELLGVGLKYSDLVEVCLADKNGRLKEGKICSIDISQDRVDMINITPIVTGVMLESMGYKPGISLGEILKLTYKWQSEDKIQHGISVENLLLKLLNAGRKP